ncbi:MAG: IclR family transcriptional regulator C-terminal domain-containing protein [Pseudomonadota bacterium]
MSSSLTRMLAVFDAFSAERPILTAEDIMARLGYSRGTAYRYVRELVAGGFLTRVAGSAYTLGPRIIELDYAIRQGDPVLNAGVPVMQALRKKFECDVLLASFYNDRVVVTHHERGDTGITVSFGRGRAMPVYKGAPSKAILSVLSPARQKKIYTEFRQDIAAEAMGSSLEEFRSKLAVIKKQGHCISLGELDPGNVGVGVPLSPEPASAGGSLSLVISRARYDVLDKALLVEVLTAAARQVENLTLEASHATA